MKTKESMCTNGGFTSVLTFNLNLKIEPNHKGGLSLFYGLVSIFSAGHSIFKSSPGSIFPKNVVC